jgi:plasmid replication initiation protein
MNLTPREKNKLIVPLVGDFAGDKAIRSVAKYLKEHNATVTAFYLSNVEQYLFQDNQNWKKFYSNVATLPLDSASTFIRSAFNMGNGYSYASSYGYMRSVNLLCSMVDLLKAYDAGQIARYADVLNMSK